MPASPWTSPSSSLPKTGLWARAPLPGWSWERPLTRGDLIHLALMSSENRAAHALGRHYPGGLPAFVQAMNAKARRLGMASAHFVDPAGLSCDNVASAEDLSKLVMAASENPVIREYSTDRGYSVRVGRRTLEYRNTNALVSNPTWNIIVQKTGYITEAGPLPGDAGCHTRPHGCHRPPEFRRQEHPGLPMLYGFAGGWKPSWSRPSIRPIRPSRTTSGASGSARAAAVSRTGTAPRTL